MCLIRFWSERAKYEINKFSTCTYSFMTFFFMDPDPDFSGSEFSADPDLDSRKKFDPDPEKNPDPKHCPEGPSKIILIRKVPHPQH